MTTQLQLIAAGSLLVFLWRVHHRRPRRRAVRRPARRPTATPRHRQGVTGPRHNYTETDLDAAFEAGMQTGIAREQKAQQIFEGEA